jgi:hypothetical protein
MNFNPSHPVEDLTPKHKPLVDHYIDQSPKYSNNLLSYIIDFPDTNRCLCCGVGKVGVSNDLLVVWICYICYKYEADKYVHIAKGVETDFNPLNDRICKLALGVLSDH